MADEHLISLQPGTVIAGRYEVVKCLGAGSMGLVYACRHRELSGHLVAIKVLFPEVAQDKIAAARFKNEIFASYGVSHPNVVRAYEFIRDGDLVAYTMEYVGGGDLADRLGRPEDPIAVNDVIRLLSQMCLGVQAIHDAGIVHRDLKPENILLTKDGNVKIADFGIARTGHGPKLTEHGGVVGTIDYVSPEYMMNAQVDWRSDIYALGILAYEMVAGESPFRGDSVYATMTKRLKADPPAPGTLRVGVPPELDRIILRAMHRDPQQRYQSAAEMFHDLRILMPDKVSMNGTEFPKATTYVGPSLSTPTEPDRTNDNLGFHSAPNGLSDRSSSENPRSRDSSGVMMEETTAQESRTSSPRFSWEQNTSQRAASPGGGMNYYEARAGSTEINNIAQQFQEQQQEEEGTIHEPIRMERMLAPSNLITDTWDSEPRGVPQVVKIPQGGINTERLRKLSQAADQGGRSLWVDVITLLVAIVIGIGIGFALLKVFAPHLLSRGAAVSIEAPQ